jgi:chromosome partitioning protein
MISRLAAAVGLKKDFLIIDTPAAVLEDVGAAIVLADVAVMVVRPTLLDLAGLVRTLSLVWRLGKPSIVVVNQAPLAPVILRSRAIYQTALESARSVEEMPDKAAAEEMAALWEFVEGKIAAARAVDEAG